MTAVKDILMERLQNIENEETVSHKQRQVHG
jgi:hypothetical protein